MTHDHAIDDAASRFVETMGLIAEGEGMARIMGRIFGFLLLAERPQSLDEMAAALGVSKASVSTDARRLEDRELLVRVALSGDRRDYYEIAPDFMARALRAHLQRMRAMRDAVADVRPRLDAGGRVAERLAAFEHGFGCSIERLEQDITALARRSPSATTASLDS